MAVLAFLAGCVNALVAPVYSSLLAELVPAEDLLSALSLSSAQYNLGRIIGPSLAALAMAAGGLATAFFCNAASFVAVLVSLVLVQLPPLPEHREHDHLWAEIATGFRVAREDAGIRTALVLTCLISVLVAPFIALIPVYAITVFGHGAAGTSLLATARAWAAIAAAVLTGTLADRWGRRRLVSRMTLTLGVVAITRSGDSTWHHLARAAHASLSFQAGTLVVEAPSHRSEPWVGGRFAPRAPRLQRGGALGAGRAVEIVAPGRRGSGAGALTARLPPTSADGRRPGRPPTLNPRYTFDQFVIGDGNRLAHAAALAVAELPGQAYNPLFLYGPPGLGKTHLLHAIAQLRQRATARAERPLHDARGVHRRFVGALKAARSTPSRRRYRDTDILLIDDVQFLERKAKVEEEFFHTFNALYGAGANSSSRATACRATSTRSRTACASGSSPAWSPTPPARPRHAHDDPAQARPARRLAARRPARSCRSPSASTTTCARSRAR